MALNKFALCFTFLVYCVGVAIVIGISDSHNIDQCDPTTVTVNLWQTNIYVPAQLLDYVAKNVTYPKSGTNTHKITCLKVINMDPGDHGGYPEVISGGVGTYEVQINMTSQWSQPLNFRIEIWADE